MKGLIVYQSNSGATKAYAQWLAEETGFPAVTARQARHLTDYDLVIVGSNVRMYKPTLAKWLLSRWAQLSKLRPVLFTVAGARANDPKRTQWVETSLGEIAGKLPHFALDGKMKFADMPWLDRKLMNFAIKMTAKSNPAQAAQMGQEYDRVDRQNLEPLRQHLQSLGVPLHSQA